MKVYYVYLITNTVNGKSYVGMTCNVNGVKGRYAAHKSNSIRYVKDSQMYDDMRTFGFDKFTVETLMICSKKHAEMYEHKFIQNLKCLEPNGYNKDPGGLSGYSRSKETIESCSSSRKEDTLPMYITRVRARSGFIVNIPGHKRKYFQTPSYTLEYNLMAAYSYYDKCIGVPTCEPEYILSNVIDRTLPRGIVKSPVGYGVKLSNKPRKIKHLRTIEEAIEYKSAWDMQDLSKIAMMDKFIRQRKNADISKKEKQTKSKIKLT